MSDNTTADAIKRDFLPGNQRPPRSGLSWWPLVIVVVLAGGGAWLWWQQQQRFDGMQSDYQSLLEAKATLTRLQQEQDDQLKRRQQQEDQLQQLGQGQLQLQGAQQQLQGTLQQQLQTALKTLDDQNARVGKMAEELASLRARVADLGTGAVRNQVLGEVAGLLRLADQRLQVAQDSDAALVLLTNADALLQKFNEAPITTLRNELAGDITALKAAQQNDVRQLHGQLGDAVQLLGGLLPVSKTAVNTTELKTSTPATTTSGWFDQALGFLGQYFVVTKRAAAVTPLLTPEQGWFIRKSIELQLQQARLAALDGDAALYKRSLGEAQSAIADSLQGDNKEALLAKLKTLEAAPLRSALPSLAPALVSVQQLLAAPKAGAAQ